MIAASRIEARRPILSPKYPHRNDPITVPEIPHSGYSATGRAWAVGFRGDFSPYSAAAPGAMKARVTGFITSMVMAAAMTSSSATWAGLSGAASRALTRIFDT